MPTSCLPHASSTLTNLANKEGGRWLRLCRLNLSFFAKNAVRYTTSAWLGRSVLHCFCIQTYMFASFFGQKRGSLYYGRMAWGIRYASLGAWDLRFGRLRYTTASKRSVPLQKPELRFVIVRWDPGGGAIGLLSGIIPRRYMSINAYPRIPLRLLAWLLSALE